MYESLRIINDIKPKYVIWENVKNLLSKKHRHNFDAYLETMEQLGYTNYYQVLNAKDYGIPQNRERVFTISIRNDIKLNFEFPNKQELKLKLKDLLEDEVEEKYYLSDKAIKGRITTTFNKYKLDRNTINDKDIHPTLLARYEGCPTLYIKNATKQGYLEGNDGDGCYITNLDKKRGTVQKQMIPTLKTAPDIGVIVKNTENYIEWKEKGRLESECRAYKQDKISGTIMTSPKNKVLLNNKLRIRKLTPKECWRLMGFSDSAFDKASNVCSNSQLYKQAGNSIVVDVLCEILKKILMER